MIEEANFNLVFMYFIGINPEDSLPDKSLLSKFRTQRLGETTLDEIIIEIVRQCVEKGVLKGTSVSIDATHIEANTIKKTPDRAFHHLKFLVLHGYFTDTRRHAVSLKKYQPDLKQGLVGTSNYIVNLTLEEANRLHLAYCAFSHLHGGSLDNFYLFM